MVEFQSTIDTVVASLQRTHHIELEGDFEVKVEGDNVQFCYHSPFNIVGVVSSKLFSKSQYKLGLLSFMECLATLEGIVS